MNKMIILSALLIASVLSRGPCDQKLECQDRVFGTSDRALCTGYRGCMSAQFGTTDYNPICSGALSCQDATITELPSKILCNGFEACKGMKKGVRGTEKVACNGLKACQGVIGKLTAPVVTCDGDIACVNKKIVAAGTPPVGVENKVACNGKKSCFSCNVIAEDKIDCDGDTACKQAELKADIVACGGKRSCYESTVRGPQTVYAYGFNAIANSQISGRDGDEEIRALGMNSLMGTTVTTGQSGTTTILGYGFKSLVGAAIKCLGTTTCDITCRMNACKAAEIFVGPDATLIVDPIECDPRDPEFAGVSRKDAALGARTKGVNCPVISGPGVLLTDADLDIDEWEKTHFESFKESTDYMEMIESAQIAEESLDAMIADQVAAFDNLDLDIDQEQEELMVVGHTVSSKNNALTSNLLTGLAVFIMTLLGSLCYIAYKFGGKNGESKALLQ